MKYDRYSTTNNYIKIVLMNFNYSINNLKYGQELAIGLMHIIVLQHSKL